MIVKSIIAMFLACLFGLNTQEAASSSAGSCGTGSQPLLWRVTSGNQTLYVLGSHKEKLDNVEPVPSSVLQTISCADVALFPVACTPGDEGGLGNFYEHCKNYPISDPQDAVALRLSSEQVANLQKALDAVAEHASGSCSTAAVQLKAISDQLTSRDFRRSLRFIYLQAVAVLDEAKCSVDAMQPGANTEAHGGYEGWVRQQIALNGRPSFGLTDATSPCAMISGQTAAADRHLAGKISKNFVNPQWRARFVGQQRALAQALKCGDVAKLASLRQLLHIDFLGRRNPKVVKRIFSAMQEHAGKKLLVAVPIANLLDTNRTKSVLSLLAKTGYKVARVSANEDLNCGKSVNAAPGAKELGRCLTPHGHAQPKSCSDFNEAMKQKLAPDPMYGQESSDAHCNQCYILNEPCTCDFHWRNTTSFKEMCEQTNISGVHGQVLRLDLTRNPGSSRTGPGLAEKMVIGSRMKCYATSCSIPLLQEVATRNWYRSEPELNIGLVTLRIPDETQDSSMNLDLGAFSVQLPDLRGGIWSIVMGAFLLMSVVIGIATCCFMIPRATRSKKTRGVPLESESDSDVRQIHCEDHLERESTYGPDGMEGPALGPLQEVPPTSFDAALIQQAMDVSMQLEDAGRKAVQMMNLQTLQGLQMQALHSGIIPPTSPVCGTYNMAAPSFEGHAAHNPLLYPLPGAPLEMPYYHHQQQPLQSQHQLQQEQQPAPFTPYSPTASYWSLPQRDDPRAHAYGWGH